MTCINKLVINKEYNKALNLLNDQKPSDDTEADKKICNLSYINYLMGNYEMARDIVLDAIGNKTYNIWPRLYYRLAKAYEGLQDYDAMCESYDKMYELLPENDRGKSAKYMQDYYNKDVLFMQQWVIANGGTINNLQIEYYDTDYRGMNISANVKPDESLIQVPWKCIISLEESKKSNPYVKHIVSAGTRITSIHTYLAMELIYLRNTNGFQMPYIRCLPKYFNNVPINFTIEELNKLEGSYALVKIMQKLLLLKSEYDIIATAFGDSNCPFTFGDFVWARTAVITRVYAIKRNGIADNVLVPFADMANHETPPNTKWWFDDNSNAFTVKSEQHLKRGDIIYETYGYKCNYRYFVNYGFTVDKNKNEEVSLICNYSLKELINKYISDILGSCDKEVRSGEMTICDLFEKEIYHKTTQQIMEYILSERNIYQVGYTYNDVAIKMFEYLRSGEPISRQSEISIHTTILAIIDDALSRFITELADDEIMLKEYEYGFNMRNAIVMRKEEKKVLHFWKALSSSIVEALDSANTKTAFKKLNKKLIKWPDIKTFAPYLKGLEELCGTQ